MRVLFTFASCAIMPVLFAYGGSLRLHSSSCQAYPDRKDMQGRLLESYGAEMMLDDNPETYACLLDETTRADMCPVLI